MSHLPTPDFYDYAWVPLDGAVLDGRFVRLRWHDGIELDAFDSWLRESAVGSGVDPTTREGLIDPAHLSDDVRIASVRVTEDGALAATWTPDGSTTEHHPGWLRHVAEGHHLPASWLPTPITWDASSLRELPTHDADAAIGDGKVFGAWLDDLLRFGVSRLERCPIDQDFNVRLAARIGAVRETNFNGHWSVKADVTMAGAADTNSTANTNYRLGPHTDLPTREMPPGFQFLHCIANEASGGASTMADGAAVVDALREEHPEHYDALTTLRWVFFNRGPGIDHRWSGPLIDHGVVGSPLTLRAFYPVRGFPDMEPDDVPRAYEALRCFSRLADSDRFKLVTPFRPGDLVAFDNRRILHGRDAFESGGHRHLRGMYIDQDDVRSTARVLNRRLGQTH